MSNDLISRSALLKRLEMISKNCKANKAISKDIGKQIFDIAEKTVKGCIMAAKNAPAVDAVPVVHGRWVKDKTVQVMAQGGQKYHNRCSVCGWLTRLHNLNYCPNCGAKMDGGKDDATD